jgi:hypothetical protein
MSLLARVKINFRMDLLSLALKGKLAWYEIAVRFLASAPTTL